MQTFGKQANHKGIFTPFTRLPLSDSETTSEREVVSTPVRLPDGIRTGEREEIDEDQS